MEQEPNIKTALHKTIKKRVILHDTIQQTKTNKNCPKFILGHCLGNYQSKLIAETTPKGKYHIDSSFKILQNWVRKGQKDRLTIRHLRELFGESADEGEALRKYYLSKAFFKFLSKNLLDVLFDNEKIQNIVSYFICIQKFTARLPNPDLIYKLQFK